MRGKVLRHVAAFVFLCASGLAVAHAQATSSLPGQPPEIPEPDYSGMQSPVVQRIRETRAALVREPQSAMRWGKFGAVCHAHSQFAEAAVAYRRARVLAPDDIAFSYLLAVVLERSNGEPAEIVELLREVIRKQPGYTATYIRLGRLLEQRGRSDEAREVYARAVELNPDLAIARYSLGQTLLSLGELEAAVLQLNRATVLAPKDGMSRAALARAYRQLGDMNRAREVALTARSLKSALAFSDSLIRSVESLRQTSLAARKRFEKHLAAGNYTRAIPELLTFEKTRPDHPYYAMVLALSYDRSNQPRKAEEYFAKALRHKLAILQSPIADARKQKQSAKADGVIVTFCPEFIEQRRAAGDIVTLQRLTALLDASKSVLPKSASLQTAWGEACRAIGDRGCAVKHYQKAIELDPNSPATERLAALLSSIPEKESP